MMPRMVDAEHAGGHRIRIRFADGAEGEVNLGPELDGEIFAPLKDVEYFRRFSIHPELCTLAWPNGADFAPEFLYERIRVRA